MSIVSKRWNMKNLNNNDDIKLLRDKVACCYGEASKIKDERMVLEDKGSNFTNRPHGKQNGCMLRLNIGILFNSIQFILPHKYIQRRTTVLMRSPCSYLIRVVIVRCCLLIVFPLEEVGGTDVSVLCLNIYVLNKLI